MIGALAGWAAGALLAVLSALYVAHAREVKRLREWTGGAPERTRHPPAPPVERRIGGRQAALALVVVLALGATIRACTGDDRATTVREPPKQPKRPAAVEPADVTVAVLNGTTVPGLAAALRDQLATAGFKRGRIDVYYDQQVAQSVVQHTPGHQAEAKAVGRELGISRRATVTETLGASPGTRRWS